MPYIDPLFSLLGRQLLATISRRWQWVIERQSFRRIYLKSTELDIFQQIVTDHRRRFVQLISYTIILPEYTLEACTQFEREADRQINNTAFTIALYKLFQILQSWGSTDESGNPYSLRVEIEDIYSPMDHGRRTSTILFPSQNTRGARGDNRERTYPRDLQQNRFEYSSLYLLQSVDLPIVPVIRHFITNHNKHNARMIAPESALEILRKLPNLRICLLDFDDQLVNYPALRRARRNAFARAFDHARFPNSIEFISIEMGPR